MSDTKSLATRILHTPALVYLAATVLSRLGGFLLIPLYTRQLSETEYGDYSLAQTAIALLPVLCTLGLSSTIPRTFFAQKDERVALADVSSVARTVLTMSAVVCAMIVSAALLLGRPSGLWSPWSAACIAIAVVGSTATAIPDALLRARQRPFQAAAFQLSQFVFAIAAGVLFVRVLGRGLRGALEALAVANAITGALALAFIARELPGKIERGAVRAALLFSLPLIPHFVAAWSQGAIDRWVLKSHGLTAQLGNYALATQLIAPIAMAVSAWNDTESARLGAAFRAGGISALLSSRRRLYAGYIAVPLVLGALVLLALPLIPWVLGRDRFSGALPLVPILVATGVIEALYYPSSNLLYYAGITSAITFATFASATINVLLNVLLVPRFHLAGAIAARSVALVFRSVVISLLAHHLLARALRASAATREQQEGAAQRTAAGAE